MSNSNIFYLVVAISSLVLVGLATPAKSQVAKVVDDVCLGCICEAISGCNRTETCSGDICGIFRITWFYWADSGKLTVDGESPESATAFENCALNANCATQTVQNYMQTFQQDCNGDSKVDCYDYAAIHQLGGYGCPGRIFGSYARILNQCLSAYIPPESLEEPTTNATQNADITSERPAQITESGQLQVNITEILPILQSEEITKNFDYKVTVPSLSVLEIISENTTASPMQSGLILGNEISVSQEILVRDKEPTIAAKDVMGAVSNNEIKLSLPVAKVVDDVCLGCICQAISSCNRTDTCSGDVCGIFRITWFYWADGGKLTVNGESPESPKAFENCALNSNCATQTVQNYMQKFKQDCNGDGKTDCLDYATLHQLGGYGCPGRIFGNFARELNQCLSAFITPETENLEKPTTNADAKPADTTSEKPPQATASKQLSSPQSEEITKNFDFIVTLPKLSDLEVISQNTTNASSIVSGLTLGNEIIVSQAMMVSNKDATIATIDDIIGTLSNNSLQSTMKSIGSKSNLKGRTIQIIEDRIPNKLDGILKSDEQPRMQDTFVEALARRNRIEKEGNEILKEIAESIKHCGTDGADDAQLKIRTIESNQQQLFTILERIEKMQRAQIEKYQLFQGKILEAIPNKNRIAEERNEILKEIAKNIKKSATDDIVGTELQKREIEENLFNILERIKSLNDH